MNPESSRAAEKRGIRSTRTNGIKKTGMVQYTSQADVDELVYDDNCFSVVSSDPARAVIQASPPNSMLSPCKQCSYPRANLNHPALWPTQQTGRKTNIKQVSELATCTVNSKGHPDRTAIAECDEPNSAADKAEPPRKIVRTMPTIDSTIMVEQDRPYR